VTRRMPVPLLVAVVGVLTASCGGGGAPTVLVTTPNPRAAASRTPSAAGVSCASSLDDAVEGTSDLQVTGPCSFTQRSGASCTAQTDDFYAYVRRPMDTGEVDLTINIESYTGPGDYPTQAQMYLQVSQDGVLYPWSQLQSRARVTAGPGAITVTLDMTTMPASAGTAATGIESAHGFLTCVT
jgi:hypothetical protein